MMQVLLLIMVLLTGHPQFSIRECVTVYLSKNCSSYLSLLKLAEHCRNLEIASRATGLLDCYYYNHAEEMVMLELPDNWQEFPWIDAAPEDELFFINEYLNSFIADDDWTYFRDAAKMYLTDRVRYRLPVRTIIRRWCSREMRWWANGGIEAPVKPIWKDEF
jgi:hypothetical protein